MKPYRVPQLAKKYVDYDMIQQHTEMPAFPDSRTRLLFNFLKRNARNHGSSEELYALVTSLVQMGLDTHDLIDTSTGVRSEEDMRSRQLKVLAGDYFSSRFYQLLSLAGHIHVVSSLSEGVCEVNAGKMRLYAQMKQFGVTHDDYLSEMTRLKEKLFLSFTPMIAPDDQEIWTQLLHELTLCDTLTEEWDRRLEADKSRFSYMFWYLFNCSSEDEKNLLKLDNTDSNEWRKLTMKYRTDQLVLNELRSSIERIRSISLDNLDSEDGEFDQMLLPFLTLLDTPQPVVREG